MQGRPMFDHGDERAGLTTSSTYPEDASASNLLRRSQHQRDILSQMRTNDQLAYESGNL